jgi:hypothetical protein
MAFMPDNDEPVPLLGGVALDLHVLLAADLAVRDQRVGAVSPPLPAVPRTDDVLSVDRAADADVRAEMLAVRVEYVHRPRFGSEHDEFLPEVVHALDLTHREVRGESDDEPAGGKAVGRQCDAGRTEFPLGGITGGVRGKLGRQIGHGVRHVNSSDIGLRGTGRARLIGQTRGDWWLLLLK